MNCNRPVGSDLAGLSVAANCANERMKAWAVRSHALNPGTGPRSVCINQPARYIKFYITILIRRRLGLWRAGASGPSKPGWFIRRRAFMATRLALVSAAYRPTLRAKWCSS